MTTKDCLVRKAASDAQNTMEMFLRNFANVPDERLTWTPSPTAKSALRIAAHTATYAARFAQMIRTRSLPSGDVEAWIQKCRDEEMAVGTREGVERLFREGTALVIEALEGLTEEDIDMRLGSGDDTMSMAFLMGLPALHAAIHMGQIDFLQTCWGDQQVYVG